MYRYLLFFSLLAVAGCRSSESSNDDLATFNVDSLTQKIVTLASDEFQGRRPFTQGETRTVEYLSKTFSRIGLEPGNNGSYFQEVPMVEITPNADRTMKIEGKGKKFELKFMDDYVLWTRSTESLVSLTKDELVFAGFGVVAPEYNWDDYAGTDVKGKVVIVMVNDPGFGTGDTTLFKGKAMTYYGRWTYKFEEASRHGAKGCLIVHNEAAASYPFAVVQNSWSGSQLHLDPRGKSEYRVAVEGWLTEDAAKKLLSASQGDATLLSKAQQKGFKAVPLGLTAATSMNVKSVFNQSKNVIGRITGTKRPGEYIVFTAHWDHFGIGKPDEGGDSIYNGALDNASGTAALLELARAFKNMHTPPERSLIFLAVTGEEQGLLGSEFYAENPIYPLDKTVANINVDGINNIGKARDINIVGVGQSELEDYLAKEVAATGRYISKDQHPEAGHYFRSDHFSFAKVGVPALTTAGGVDNIEHGIAFGKQKDQEYSDKYYHRPGDEYNAQYWNLEGGLDDIKLLFLVGKRLAFETTWPKWKETSEFRKLRNP